ncbi:MAG: hypothetical protein QNJ68_15175 [Microcoleaceae cyanobacterium MO_207.B10]|nr:hypothetical protein [Microcoleaceae cyanobacterium MO_207.B10]
MIGLPTVTTKIKTVENNSERTVQEKFSHYFNWSNEQPPVPQK